MWSPCKVPGQKWWPTPHLGIDHPAYRSDGISHSMPDEKETQKDINDAEPDVRKGHAGGASTTGRLPH